jgi:hypothetical protein
VRIPSREYAAKKTLRQGHQGPLLLGLMPQHARLNMRMYKPDWKLVRMVGD